MVTEMVSPTLRVPMSSRISGSVNLGLLRTVLIGWFLSIGVVVGGALVKPR